MKKIIFEGHDNSGKTTIAKYCANKFNYAYFKHKRQQVSFVEENRSFIKNECLLLLDILNQIEIKMKVLLIDRHLPSEYAYSKSFGRKINEDEIFELDKILANNNFNVVYCFKDYFTEEFFDEIIDKNKINILKFNYDKYFAKSRMKVLFLNTTNEDLENQVIKINKFIKG